MTDFQNQINRLEVELNRLKKEFNRTKEINNKNKEIIKEREQKELTPWIDRRQQERAAYEPKVIGKQIKEIITAPAGVVSEHKAPMWFKKGVALAFFDGANAQIDGMSGAGAVVFNANRDCVAEASKYIARGTVNTAEYTGLIVTLELIRELGLKEVHIYGDSKLVIYQVTGRWQTHAETMKRYLKRVNNLREEIGEGLTFRWIPREKNEIADLLSKKGIGSVEEAIKYVR